MTVGVLLLAAGSSRRFGSDKRLAALASGHTVLNTTIDQILAAQLPLLVCLGADDMAIAKTLLARNVPSLLCQHSHLGMGATLSAGAARLKDWGGVLIALADMPFICPDTYGQVASALQSNNIAIPTRNGLRGHPVGFGQQWFENLRALQGDKGGLSIVQQNESAVIEVPCSDVNLQRDIDVPENIPGLSQ